MDAYFIWLRFNRYTRAIKMDAYFIWRMTNGKPRATDLSLFSFYIINLGDKLINEIENAIVIDSFSLKNMTDSVLESRYSTPASIDSRRRMSHRKAHLLHLESGQPVNAIVLEDGFYIFLPLEVLTYFLFSNNVNFVDLSHDFVRHSEYAVESGVNENSKFSAYIITQKGALIMSEYTKQLTIEYDKVFSEWISDIVRTVGGCYSTTSSIVRCNESYSIKIGRYFFD
jgi:hypothetical protein